MSRFISGQDERFQESERKVNLSGGTVTGVINSPNPSANNHLANLSYVNTIVAGLPLASNTNSCVFLASWAGTGCTGTWTVPANVTNIFVQVWGGGAGGSQACSWRAAAPGGGGGYSHRSIATSPGQVWCYCAGGGGDFGRNYPGPKRGCQGCTSRFCGPTSGGTVCMIACGGCSGLCSGTLYGTRACGGLSSGGDINIPGGDGYQFACCSQGVNKQCGTGRCWSNQFITAGGSFLGAPNRQMRACVCVPDHCGLPFGGGGHGGVSGMYSNVCSCGVSGGPGAVLIWF
jgi:hypothetical protein